MKPIPLLLLLLLLLPGPLAATSLSIEGRIGHGAWQKHSLVPLHGENVSLRIVPGELEEIRWYLIVPDLSRQYQNANFP